MNANTLCFTLDSVNYQQQSASVSSTQLVQVSNKINDGYRFGFNGQEKDNEIAGVGNHNTAEFWEYSTQTGIRWNRDPRPVSWESPYVVNGDNPIFFNDPKGDFKTKFGAKVYNFLHGGKGEIRKATGGENKGEWFVGKQVEYKGEGAGVAYERKFGCDKGIPANGVDNAANWWNNSELYFNANGKFDVGVQAGGHVQVAGAKVALEGSLMTVDIVGATYEQKESEYGPQSFDFDYIGKGGNLQVSQYAGASYYAGAEYKHSFKGRLSGGYSDEKHTVTVNAVAVKYQAEKNANQAMTNDFSISISGRVALILGIEGEVSFGVRDKEKGGKK
jgi:hypothetical protein